MATLNDDEKRDLLRLQRARFDAAQVREDPVREPPPPLLGPREYVEFAAFAARFFRGSKPVRFGGNHWKL